MNLLIDCKNGSSVSAIDEFCNKEREMMEQLTEKESTLIHGEKRSKFMISITASHTVDETTYFVFCEQSKGNKKQ